MINIGLPAPEDNIALKNAIFVIIRVTISEKKGCK